MAAPRAPVRPVSVDEVMRQLSVERQLRGAVEQSLRDVRRDNVRLVATSQTRNHFVILVPKPKWSAWRDAASRWAAAARAWVLAAARALRDAAWPRDD